MIFSVQGLQLMSYTCVAKLETNVSSKSPLQSTSRKFMQILHKLCETDKNVCLRKERVLQFQYFPLNPLLHFKSRGKKITFSMRSLPFALNISNQLGHPCGTPARQHIESDCLSPHGLMARSPARSHDAIHVNSFRALHSTYRRLGD